LIESVVGFFEAVPFGRQVAIFILSMVPGIGPSLTIPLGVGLGLPIITSTIVSIFGNIFPVPFIIIFVSKIFAWMRKVSPRLGRLADKFDSKAQKYGRRLRHGQIIGLLLFVAIPIPFIPGTGAATGALIAAMLGIRLKTAVLAISAGSIISSIFVAVATFGITTLFFN